jgi:hypothetical protein
MRNDAPDNAVWMRQQWRLCEMSLEQFTHVLVVRTTRHDSKRSCCARAPPLPHTPGGGICTTLSLIPTGTGNTVRSFYYARTTVRSPRKLDHGLTL